MAAPETCGVLVRKGRDLRVQSGNGMVTITQVRTTVPEPQSYALLGLGFIACGLLYRLRKQTDSHE